FMHPYKSTSITEFWRRWHMTLSRFFRDYLYIPLGGNRVGPARQYFNLWAVFLLCGLWHGASWAFVIWGAWQGIFLTIERMGLGKWLKNNRAIAHIYVTWCFLMGWVFFRSQSMDQAFNMFGAAYSLDGWGNVVNEIGAVASNYQLFIILVGCIMVYPVRRWLEANFYLLSRRMRGTNVKPGADGETSAPVAAAGIPGIGVTALFTILRTSVYGLAALYALAAMAANTHQAFIYFRF
ncbi:MAG: MBOAT family O-acyltransferase, partial [Pseudomonadota bacterium]